MSKKGKKKDNFMQTLKNALFPRNLWNLYAQGKTPRPENFKKPIEIYPKSGK